MIIRRLSLYRGSPVKRALACRLALNANLAPKCGIAQGLCTKLDDSIDEF